MHLGDGAEVAVRVVAHDHRCGEDGHDAAERERFSKQVGQVAENDHHGALEHWEQEHAAVPGERRERGRQRWAPVTWRSGT